MCGIFGLMVSENSDVAPESYQLTVRRLFQLSESRGKEAAGLALRSEQGIKVYKEPMPASTLVKSRKFKQLFRDLFHSNGNLSPNQRITKPIALIGHSRLVTNGLQTQNENNQPVIGDGLVGIHNGIIANDEEIWNRFPDMKRRYEVDTEVILRLIQRARDQGASLAEAVQLTFAEIEGAASIAVLVSGADEILLATNTGSLYLCCDTNGKVFTFASERYILDMLLRRSKVRALFHDPEIFQVKPGEGYLLRLTDLHLERFELEKGESSQPVESSIAAPLEITDLSSLESPDNALLQRCNRCVLPETMPFIDFDETGVCGYCRNYEKMSPKGPEALEEAVAPFRSKSGEPDCIVAFSGGRDSSYGLHYIKTVLKMNPLAFTYDWGMITDLARRNQARICGKLGVEHILISADIKKKRNYILKNIKAWLKRPDIGMVPLFMAGDKQFYYYAHKLRKENNVDLIIFCAGNEFEKTDFKLGFCGIPGGSGKGILTDVSVFNKLKLASYYAKQYLLNPSYINKSIFDTLFAYYSSYIMRDDYLYLYHYLKWDEEEIMSLLRDEFDWEVATDTKTTWRIGDGTAAFYNYIYYAVAGFTEFDTFRSNQVREGILDREEALRLINEDNKPRWESIRWYAQMIGFDPDEAIAAINAIPKLYKY